ncbi:hypothetical protein Tco_1225544 [Tanacetum coccineum]
MYKEYLAEFWYSTITLENSKVSFSIPTGGIFGEVGVNTFKNAIGAHYLAHSSEYVAPPSIDIVRQFPTIGYREEVSAKGTLRKSLLPPSLANGINIDHANIFWEDVILKLKKKQREKVVPYTRFISLLIMHKMKEGYEDDEVTLYPTQVFSVNNWALKPNQPEEPPFTYHMLAICAVDKPVAFKALKPSSIAERVPQASFIIHSESASGNDASAVSTAEADPGNSAPSDFVSQQQGMNEGTKNTSHDHLFAGINPHVLAEQTKSVSEGLDNVITQPITGKGASLIARQVEEEEASRTIKLEDLAKLSDAEKDDGIHATRNVKIKDTLFPKSSSPKSYLIPELANQVLILHSQKHKLELEKNEAEAVLLKAQSSFPNVEQLNELLDIPSKLNELTGEVQGLKKQVYDWEIELPGDLNEIPTKLEDFTKTITSLLSHVTKALNMFAQVLDSASSKAGDQSVPSAGQADTVPAEGEKNTNQATIS